MDEQPLTPRYGEWDCPMAPGHEQPQVNSTKLAKTLTKFALKHMKMKKPTMSHRRKKQSTKWY